MPSNSEKKVPNWRYVCVYIFLVFTFLLLKKGTRKEREREKKMLPLEINPQTSCWRREVLLRQESRT